MSMTFFSVLRSILLVNKLIIFLVFASRMDTILKSKIVYHESEVEVLPPAEEALTCLYSAIRQRFFKARKSASPNMITLTTVPEGWAEQLIPRLRFCMPALSTDRQGESAGFLGASASVGATRTASPSAALELPSETQGEKGLMAKGPAIMLNVTPYLSIVVIHLDIMSGFEYDVAKCNSMA
jgi:hypothetical protein